MSSTRGIYGLSGSGIDVDSMVKVGMMTRQNEYDKMYKKEVKNEWIKTAYTDLYSDLQTFSSSTMYDYKLSSKTDAMLAESADTAVATATANADASSMTHTVNVTSTASSAYLLSTGKITRDNSSSSSSSVYLKDIVGTAKYSDADKDKVALAFTLSNGESTNSSTTTKTITFTYADIYENNETLNDLVSKINATDMSIHASYDSDNDAFSLNQQNTGKANQINLAVAKVGTTDGTEITESAANLGATLINNLSLGAVTQGTDKTGKTTSTLGSALSFTGTTTNGTTTYSGTISAEGSNAQVVIDGKTYNTASNKVTVGGVTYTTKDVGSTTVAVSQDTDTIVSNVKQFVEDYNKMLDKLNDLYYEDTYSDYDVLTKTQEAAMTTDEVTKWNEKAKSGLLNHSKIVGDLRSALREAIYTPVDSVDSSYNSMMAIGIKSKTDRGHLTLDEDKLKKALAADPDCVYQLFASSGDDAKGNTVYSNEGVVNRITDAVRDGMSDITDYAGTSSTSDDDSTLGDLIRNLKTQMSSFKTMMDAYEDALYDKYDAMESAIQSLSSTYNYISGS